MKFLSPEVALYRCISTIQPCMEYCCHVARSCYLQMLDKLQKRLGRTVGPSLTALLEPFANLRNVASLSPLTYDLNGFKSRINRHILSVGSL